MDWSGSVAEAAQRTDDARPVMRWWGWGDATHPSTLSAAALGFLTNIVGMGERARPAVALERVHVEASRLSERQLAALRRIVGVRNVRDDHSERVLHAAGKGYPDLVRQRAGEPEATPDVVVMPDSAAQVRAVLELCSRASVAVVPFGGGTSVVGGVAPLCGVHAGVLALDMCRMGSVVALDRESQTVVVQAGARAPALERFLDERGLTLGHFPQSFEYVSLGGCAATRSAGQASGGYGSIEKMILGLRLTAPEGDIELPAMPASAAGPSMRQLLIGSEGTLGVISELSLRVRRAPQERIYEGLMFEDFAAGVDALRMLAQEHAMPDVARLSDESETRMSLALAGAGGVRGRLGRMYVGLRGYNGGCLAILGFEGAPEEVSGRRERALELTRRGGALALGRSPGEAWLKGRFSAPYLRDELLTHGLIVETLETAVQWSGLKRLHDEVSAAIECSLSACGTPGLVMCHVSHLYESGASLYFTFLARQLEDREIEQWRAVKDAASRAIVEGGGTITHHHAIGRDHAPWMDAEIGPTAVAALRALKAQLDPLGIMNPGKLLPCQ